MLRNSLFMALYVLSSNATPIIPRHSHPEVTGLLQPVTSMSAGGIATCVSGIVPVTASTDQNIKLKVPDTFNQQQAVDLLLELQLSKSDRAAAAMGSNQTISGTYNISAQFCFPHSPKKGSELQFLSHGIGFDKSYWDFAAPNNSYIDFAAAAGYTTFSYDRLGIGKSSHPDPIQVVQGQLEVAVTQALVNMLRNGSLGCQVYDHIIAIGHSYGSALTESVAAIQPSAFDAIVLTGYSSNPAGRSQFLSSLNFESASSVQPSRFSNLPDGYLLSSTKYGIQYAFFSYTDFTDAILDKAFNTAQTTTIGEQYTMSIVAGKAPAYTGPVLIINGEYDLIFCDGNCFYPNNVLDQSLKDVFPNADSTKSATYAVSGAGHGLNLAVNANVAFGRILEFVGSLD